MVNDSGSAPSPNAPKKRRRKTGGDEIEKGLVPEKIALLQPDPTKPVEFTDPICPPLKLRLMPDGKTKTWVLRARLPSGGIRVKIARAEMHVTKARQRALEMLAQVEQGIDPRIERRAERAAAKAARVREKRRDDLLIENVVKAYLATREPKMKPRSYAELEALFRLHVLPHWRGTSVELITRRKVDDLLESLESKYGTPYRANRVLSALRPMFRYAVRKEMVAANPCMAITKIEGEVDRTRFLSLDECRVFWKATQRLASPWRQYFQLLLATGQRRSEVSRAKWEDFDLSDEMLWVLPREATKADREQIVPLSDLALKVISTLPRIVDDKAKKPIWLFVGRGNAPIGDYSGAKAKLDAAIQDALREESGDPKVKGWHESKKTEFRPHDLRRTCATHVGDALGFNPFIVGEILNHSRKVKLGVTSTYARGSMILDRYAALQAWGRLLQIIIADPRWPVRAEVLRILKSKDTAAERDVLRRAISTLDAKGWRAYVRSIGKAHKERIAKQAK